MNQLTKKSSESEIKAYFEGIAKLMQSNEPFPVNLEDVWQLVYATKSKAVQVLRRSELFMEGVDYQVLNQKVQNSGVLYRDGNDANMVGRPASTYMLSVPCLEFFIARKVRPVFEVYRKVFHKVVDTVQVPHRLHLQRCSPWQHPNRSDLLCRFAASSQSHLPCALSTCSITSRPTP